MIEYVIIGFVAVVLLIAAVVGCSKPGSDDGICKYDRKDDET